MAEIHSRNETISQYEINLCIEEFEAIKDNEEPILNLVMDESVSDIDSTLIAYFILFKTETPHLIIQLTLTGNYYIEKDYWNYSDNDQRLFGQLRQFWGYAYTTTGQSIFKTHYKDKNNRKESYKADELKPKYILTNRSYFSISSSFLPPIYIDNENNFDIYFSKNYKQILDISIEDIIEKALVVHTLNPNTIDENITRREEEKEGKSLTQKDKILTEANVKNLILSTVNLSRKNKIIELAAISFIKSLENAKILEIYLYLMLKQSKNTNKISLSSLKMGSLNYENYEYYFYSVKSIFDQLLTSPLIYHYVFSLLLHSESRNNKNDPKLKFSKENIENKTYAKNLSNLWEFTKKLVRGITELAKNIVEHSTTKKGVITARTHRKENKLFELYNNFLDGNNPSTTDLIVNINVVDLGKKGVIDTLEKSTRNLYEDVNTSKLTQPIASLLKTDLSSMKSGQFTFENLVSPDTNILLLQQAKRSIAHFGLLTLSKLILEENGAVFASTSPLNNNKKRDAAFTPFNAKYKDIALDTLEVKKGTQYCIILPVNINKSYKKASHKLIDPSDTTTQEEIEGLEKLASYKLINNANQIPDGGTDTYILHIQPDVGDIKSREDEEKLKHEIINSDLLDQSINKKIICLDLDKCNFTEKDTHILFRLLGNLEIHLADIPLIIVNLNYIILHKLLETNKLFCDISKIEIFWSVTKPVIIYSYDKSNTGEIFYFTDILWGKTEQDFSNLNHLISSTNYNSISSLYPNAESTTNDFPYASKLLINGRTPLPFDVLINKESKSLFEVNASVLLTSNLVPDEQRKYSNDVGLLEQIKNRSGYKIPDTHFKVGSKVHISDFYYAKRFFQSGAYSSHIAFILAKNIQEEILKHDGVMKSGKPNLTLIGYGLYSELLLSLTERLLNNFFGYEEDESEKINHDIIVNSDSLRLQKNNSHNKYAIIIVPISTTFSTSIKIQEKLYERKIFKDGNILSPLYSLLYISDGSPSNTCTPVEKDLGWTDKNKQTENNIILVKATYSNSNTIHKYFLSLPTKWHHLDNCEMCYPNSEEKEIVLFETDKASVTPALIFTPPKGRFISDKDLYREGIIIDKLVRSGHHRRNNHRFIHSIKSEEFLNTNIKPVKDWLIELSQQNSEFNQGHSQNDRVLIVSQCHHTNASFINLVNTYLFSSSANIIHYDPANDFTQNFKMIYGKEINEADRIVFVDDSLKSGKTLRLINYYIQSSLEMITNKGINSCITLMNKSQIDTQQWINELLINDRGTFSFYNRHLYTDHEQLESASIELEQEKYQSLIQSSVHDPIEYRFLKQLNKVTEQEHTKQKKKKKPHTPPELILNVTHFLIEYFSNGKIERNQGELLPVIEAIEQEIKYSKSFGGHFSFYKYLFQNNIQKNRLYTHLFSPEQNDEVLKAMLKVLSRPPFTLHMPVRKIVFPWVIEEMRNSVEQIKRITSTSSKAEKEQAISNLKFNMRRSCEMNSNFLISSRFLYFLKITVYGNTDLISDTNNIDFGVFYISQIKELLFKNPARCIKLQKNINEFSLVDKKNPEKIGTFFSQVIRMLLSESGLLLSGYVSYLKRKKKWINLYGKEGAVNYDNTNIINYLKEPSVGENNKLSKLNDYLIACGETKAIKNEAFLNFIWLNQFFLNDSKERIKKEKDGNVIRLQDKTELILNKISEIIKDGIKQLDHQSSDIKVGKFLIVQDIKNNPLVVFDQNEDDHQSIIDVFDFKENQFPVAMLEGIETVFKTSKKSVIELYKLPSTKKWVDLYATDYSIDEPKVDDDLISGESNRLLLFRINKLSVKKRREKKDKKIDKSLAVLGFYFKLENKIEKKPIAPNYIRYILLNRKNLAKFIQDHHNNNEFTEFQKANTIKKLAALTGHGQDTLRQLAGSGDGMFGAISADLTKIQATILFVNEEQKISYDPFKIIAQTGKSVEFSYERIQELKELAEKIYRSEDLENSIDPDGEITLDFPSEETFKKVVPDNYEINFSILKVICYELFVNAKKNRWIFFENESHSLGTTKHNKNMLSFEFKPKDGGFSIIISNTAPENTKSFISRLNTDNANTKKDGSPVSGINLIKKLVNKVLTDAKLFFTTKNEEGDSAFSVFSVEIQFKINTECHD